MENINRRHPNKLMRACAGMYVCDDGASFGLLSQLNKMVWMLIKLLRVNNPNQNHRGCAARRRTALRGFELIIYMRQDNKSDFKSNGPCSVFGTGRRQRTTIRSGESELRNDILQEMLQTCVVYFGVYGRRGGEMMQC